MPTELLCVIMDWRLACDSVDMDVVESDSGSRYFLCRWCRRIVVEGEFATAILDAFELRELHGDVTIRECDGCRSDSIKSSGSDEDPAIAMSALHSAVAAVYLFPSKPVPLSALLSLPIKVDSSDIDSATGFAFKL